MGRTGVPPAAGNGWRGPAGAAAAGGCCCQEPAGALPDPGHCADCGVVVRLRGRDWCGRCHRRAEPSRACRPAGSWPRSSRTDCATTAGSKTRIPPH